MGLEPTADAIDKVSVTTDLLEVDINLLGGGIVRAALSRYPIALAEPDDHFALLDQTLRAFFYSPGRNERVAVTRRATVRYSPRKVATIDSPMGDDDLIVDLALAVRNRALP